MKVTTVKIYKTTKSALDELRVEGESYDQVIGKLISQSTHKNLKENLIAGYKSLDKRDIKLLEEWEASSAELEND